jgi:F-type H+-transporting ATPase subunit epsilon
MMSLSVMTPREVLVERKVSRVSAEAPNGSFTLLPRHVDFAASLVPCVFSFVPEEGEEVFVAVDRGTLVKRGGEVSVSVRAAVQGEDLETLADTVREQFCTESEQERKMRSAMADVEAGMVRRFMEIDSG